MTADIDPRSRMQHILRKALEGCAYESSRREGDAALVIEARRADGRRVSVRFRGLKASASDSEPATGAPIVVKSVGGMSLWRIFLPIPVGAIGFAQRVRIEAGAARLEIVCEDVEWWEDADRPTQDT